MRLHLVLLILMKFWKINIQPCAFVMNMHASFNKYSKLLNHMDQILILNLILKSGLGTFFADNCTQVCLRN